MFPVEVITMLGSALLGGLLKLIGVAMDNSKQKHMMMMQAMAKEASIIKEAREYENRGFQWTRRILAILITFAVILWPSIAPVFWPHIDVIIGYPEVTEKFLWWGGEERIQWAFFSTAIVITPLQTHLMSAIAGLYFGSSTVKGK